MEFRGPKLSVAICDLLRDHNISGAEAARRYGVNPSWVGRLLSGKTQSPRADLCQLIYEDLTGKALLPGPEK
tara:strand:+ start:306 stop:521 length:216 start_codon:yes stop_codon:yes gene_type:complete